MSQTLINTLRFTDHLKEAGFAGPQAEALARVLSEVWGNCSARIRSPLLLR